MCRGTIQKGYRKMSKIKQILLFFSVFLLGQCGGSPIPSSTESTCSLKLSIKPCLQRVIDTEAEIACWSFAGRAGIYCLPIEETKLEVGQ